MLNNTMPKQSNFRLLILVLLVGFASSGFAQLHINSPYSRYGIGDLSTNTGAYYSSMGNMRYSLLSDKHINRANAASYMGIDSGSFLFEAGFRGQLINNMTETASNSTNYANLDYIKVAFPSAKWLRTSIGLLPFSMMGYEVNLSSVMDSIGQVNSSYLGDGGVNQVYFGNAFKINSQLSLGFNAAYLFGDLNSRRQTVFPDLTLSQQYRIIDAENINGWYFDFGLQYHKTFTKKQSKFENKTLSFGLTFTPQQNLKYNRNSLAYTYVANSSSYEIIRDTLLDRNIASGKVVMPMIIGGGLSFGEKGKWLVGVDGTYGAWQNFSMEGKSDSLISSIQLNLGGEYYINDYAIRLGARYDQGSLSFDGNQIDDLGISFGLGIPLRKYKKLRTSSIANLDLGIEVGQRGTVNAGLVKQQYVKFYMSIGIQNTWFQKIKYQ
jgi:hypothetical protein